MTSPTLSKTSPLDSKPRQLIDAATITHLLAAMGLGTNARKLSPTKTRRSDSGKFATAPLPGTAR